MTIVSPFVTDIPVDLCMALRAHSLLYWYVRACDPIGKGIVEIDTLAAATDLGKSEATVKRYVRECLKAGLFRHSKAIQQGFRIITTSLLKVAKGEGFSELGAFVEVSPQNLSQIKTIAIEAAAQQLQEQSYWRMRNHQKAIQKLKKPNVPTLENVLASHSSRPPSTEPGATTTTAKHSKGEEQAEHAKGRYFYHNSSTSPFWGGTQEEIGKNLGISRRTVQRRLSDRHRDKIGLPNIERRQQLTPVDISPAEVSAFNAEALTNGSTPVVSVLCPRVDTSPKSAGLKNPQTYSAKTVPVMVQAGKVYRYRPNVYRIEVTLRSKRYLRRSLKAM